VRLSGVLDLATVAAVDDLIIGVCRDSDLVLDLSELDFCDCAGLGLFVRLTRRYARLGGAVRLAAPRGLVLMVMSALNFGDAVPAYPDLATALRGDATGRVAHVMSDSRRLIADVDGSTGVAVRAGE
jgi:anti-anti-sigma factor